MYIILKIKFLYCSQSGRGSVSITVFLLRKYSLWGDTLVPRWCHEVVLALSYWSELNVLIASLTAMWTWKLAEKKICIRGITDIQVGITDRSHGLEARLPQYGALLSAFQIGWGGLFSRKSEPHYTGLITICQLQTPGRLHPSRITTRLPYHLNHDHP